MYRHSELLMRLKEVCVETLADVLVIYLGKISVSGWP